MTDKKSRRPDIVEWLGFNHSYDLSKCRPLGWFLGFIFLLFSLILLLVMVVSIFNFTLSALHFGPYSEDRNGEAVRNLALVLATLLGAPFIVWRTIVAAKHVKIADQSLFNDKVSEAVNNLTGRREITRVVVQNDNEVILKEWEDDLVTRCGAIDRLEGLVGENKDVASRIVRLLAAYVRGNFACANLDITEPPFSIRTPRMDLQKAIDAIGRIYEVAAQVDRSHWRLDLKECDFDGVNFSMGYFRAADFSGCRFEGARFTQGNFEGCLFFHSLLNFGDFWKANLKGARFDGIILNRPKPFAGGMVSSINLAILTGTTFIAADISALDYLGKKEVISKTFGTKDTIISTAVREKMLNSTAHGNAHLCRCLKDDSSLTGDDRENINKLEHTGFQHWSPYNSTDGSTASLLTGFYDELDMNRWPFNE